jgi:Na+/H+-dicarboxylate symporter
MLVAASTTSSAATLPVSMQCASEKIGLPEKIYGFGIPLGASICMNGLSVYYGIIAVFASNLYNIPITPMSLFQFVFLGLILTMGAAAVKGAAIVGTTVLLSTLGMPLTIMPIVAAINPIIDIGHTTLNVTGTLVSSSVTASRLGMMDHEIFKGTKSYE